jgi:hypothetical protein
MYINKSRWLKESCGIGRIRLDYGSYIVEPSRRSVEMPGHATSDVGTCQAIGGLVLVEV